MHRSLIHRTIRRSFAVTEGRKLDTQRIKASVESARYSGCDGLKEATRVVSGIYYSGLIDTELPAVAVTPAGQVSLSSRSHTCIMQRGSCSLKPAVRGALKEFREGVHVLSADFPAIRNIYTRYFEILLRDPAMNKTSLGFHRQLYAALYNRDADAARQHILAHLNQAERDVLKLLDAAGENAHGPLPS
jgi:FCD domain